MIANLLTMRRTRIPMPIASLPFGYGVGGFDKKAEEFADRIEN